MTVNILFDSKQSLFLVKSLFDLLKKSWHGTGKNKENEIIVEDTLEEVVTPIATSLSGRSNCSNRKPFCIIYQEDLEA